MTEATFTFRVEEKLKADFTAAAKASDLSGEQVLRDLMLDYVASQSDRASYDGWFRQQVEFGLACAEAGELVSAADVEAEFAARREATLAKLGGRRS